MWAGKTKVKRCCEAGLIGQCHRCQPSAPATTLWSASGVARHTLHKHAGWLWVAHAIVITVAVPTQPTTGAVSSSSSGCPAMCSTGTIDLVVLRGMAPPSGWRRLLLVITACSYLLDEISRPRSFEDHGVLWDVLLVSAYKPSKADVLDVDLDTTDCSELMGRLPVQVIWTGDTLTGGSSLTTTAGRALHKYLHDYHLRASTRTTDRPMAGDLTFWHHSCLPNRGNRVDEAKNFFLRN